MSERDAFGNLVGDDAQPAPTPALAPEPAAMQAAAPPPRAATPAAPARPRRTRTRSRRSGWFAGIAILFAVIRLIAVTAHHDDTTVTIPPFIYTDPFQTIPTVPSADDFPTIPSSTNP